MHIFDILGPVMVGPSSSHTAGAVRIGYIAKKLLPESITSAEIFLHGSFADTGVGHGTDKAIVAGLLGMMPDDIRIPNSFLLAEKAGLQYTFKKSLLNDAHPNSVVIILHGSNENQLKIQASSLGGGRVMVNKLDDLPVTFTAERPTLIVYTLDRPGHVARVASVLSYKAINVAAMQLYRNKRNGNAIMVLETDQPISDEAIYRLKNLKGILNLIYLWEE